MSEDFIVSDDLVSDDDFVASEDFVSLGLADGVVVLPVAEPLVEPVADGDFVSLPVADGELPLLSGPVEPPVAAPDEPLGLPDPLGPCASAGAATNASVTASANAPVNVFITLPPCCCGVRGFPRRPQPAWRRSATGFRKSCSAGGASTRAILGSVTGRPSRAER